MELDFTPSCVKGDFCKQAWLSLIKSNIVGYEVESTTWDSAEIEEGIFLYGGNPTGWVPWRDSLHLLYMERRRVIVIHAYDYSFHVYSDIVHSLLFSKNCRGIPV